MNPAQLEINPHNLSQMPFSLEPGTQFIPVKEGSIAYDFKQAASGKASQLLVLINGYQRSRLDFRAFRQRFHEQKPECATLALDNRGVGETQNSLATFDVTQMAKDAGLVAARAMLALDLENYATLGISMGGMIAQTLAYDNTQVSHLVLVSTTAGGKGRAWPRDKNGTELPPEAQSNPKLEYRPWPTDKEGMKARMTKYFGARFLKQSPLLFDMMISNMLKATGSQEANDKSRLQHAASANFDGTAVLKTIKARTLVVTGHDDAVIPRENASYLTSHIPGARLLEYPDVGHLILIEEPQKFVSDVAAFL